MKFHHPKKIKIIKVIEIIKHHFITNHINYEINFNDFLSDLFDYLSIVQRKKSYLLNKKYIIIIIHFLYYINNGNYILNFNI